jgi:hypothetical protein
VLVMNGRYDQGLRRRSRRTGRERGCWVYIPAEELAKTGIRPDEPAPFYRTFGRVNSVVVKLYRAG